VLVVDLDALRTVDVLDLAEQVALGGLLARDAEDVVGDERAFDEGVAGPDAIAAVDAEILAVRDQVLAFDPALILDDDRPLAAALLVEQLDAAVDLGDDGRLLGAPGLEQLGDAGEAAGDVLRAADLARGLGQQGAGGDRRPPATSMPAPSGRSS